MIARVKSFIDRKAHKRSDKITVPPLKLEGLKRSFELIGDESPQHVMITSRSKTCVLSAMKMIEPATSFDIIIPGADITCKSMYADSYLVTCCIGTDRPVCIFINTFTRIFSVYDTDDEEQAKRICAKYICGRFGRLRYVKFTIFSIEDNKYKKLLEEIALKNDDGEPKSGSQIRRGSVIV